MPTASFPLDNLEDSLIIHILTFLDKHTLTSFMKTCLRYSKHFVDLTNEACLTQETLKKVWNITLQPQPLTPTTKSILRLMSSQYFSLSIYPFIQDKGVVFIDNQGYFLSSGLTTPIQGLLTNRFSQWAEIIPYPCIKKTFIISYDSLRKQDTFLWIPWDHPSSFLSIHGVENHSVGMNRSNIVYIPSNHLVLGFRNHCICSYKNSQWEILHHYPTKYCQNSVHGRMQASQVKIGQNSLGICIFFYSRQATLATLLHILHYNPVTGRFQEIYWTQQCPCPFHIPFKICTIQDNITFVPNSYYARYGLYTLVLTPIGNVIHAHWVHCKFPAGTLQTNIDFQPFSHPIYIAEDHVTYMDRHDNPDSTSSSEEALEMKLVSCKIPVHTCGGSGGDASQPLTSSLSSSSKKLSMQDFNFLFRFSL